MNRTVTPCLSRRLSSACRTCLVKASEMGMVSSSYRSGSDEVPDARPRRLAFLESHLADGLHPADLDALDVTRSVRVVRPFPECLVAGQMPLDRLARLGRVDLTGARRGGHHKDPTISGSWRWLAHTVHLLSGTRTSGRFGGAPRRQKTSGSMVST